MVHTATAASEKACDACGKQASLRCSKCKLTYFCTSACQRKSWVAHKIVCQPPPLAEQARLGVAEQGAPAEDEQDSSGYPREDLLCVHHPEVFHALTELSRKEFQRLARKLPLMLGDPMIRRVSSGSGHAVVQRDLFAQQFESFTCSLFANWDSELWDKILVGGGAVLASLLPLPLDFDKVKGAPTTWLQYDFCSKRMRRRGAYDPVTSKDTFFQSVLWPGSDIDLFVYGLTESEATQKALAVFKQLRKTVKLSAGIDTDVYFVKTPNTITMGSGLPRRDVQIICRLYDTKQEILNGFDIDACCVGFDGQDVWITPRAIKAIRTKVNTINLQIRGASYESRLLKYAERGWAIGVPGLKRQELHRGNLEVEACKSWGSDDYSTFTGESFKKLSEAKCLEKLLVVEAAAQKFNGSIEYPFPGRMKKLHRNEKDKPVVSGKFFEIKPNAVRDEGYGRKSAKNGEPIWPATTQLAALGTGTWQIEWQSGNMPRQPMAFEEWSATAYSGASEVRYDYQKAAKERKEKERKAKEAANAEQAKAIADARTDATAQANEQNAQFQAQLQKEKHDIAAELVKVTESKLSLEHRADGILCIVCLDEPKTVMLEPCRHVCLCETCQMLVSECPLCRTEIENTTKLFLQVRTQFPELITTKTFIPQGQRGHENVN